VEKGQRFIKHYLVHRSVRHLDVALSEKPLHPLNLFLRLDAFTVSALQVYGIVDAVEDYRLKPPCLIIEPEFDEPIHELDIYLVLACFHDANLCDLRFSFAIFDKDMSDKFHEHFLLFVHVDVRSRCDFDTQVTELIITFNDLLPLSLFSHDLINLLLLLEDLLNFGVKFALSHLVKQAVDIKVGIPIKE